MCSSTPCGLFGDVQSVSEFDEVVCEADYAETTADVEGVSGPSPRGAGRRGSRSAWHGKGHGRIGERTSIFETFMWRKRSDVGARLAHRRPATG